MLALKISNRNDLESKREVLDGIARDFLNSGVENGLIRIYSYPAIESVFASSILFFSLQRLGVHSILSIRLAPPNIAEEPHILVGYSSPKISDNRSDYMRVCLTRKLAEPPSPNTFCLEFNSSLGVAVTSFLESTGVLTKEYSQLSLLSMYLASRGLKPVITEIDRAYLNDWLSRKGFEDIDSREELILHGIDYYTIAESLYYTLEPAIIGITGDKESLVEEFKSLNIEHLLSKKAREIEDRDMAQILRLITRKMNDHAKKKIDPRDLVGEVIFYKRTGVDMVTLKHILYYAIAKEGSFNPVMELVYDPKSFANRYLVEYEKLVDQIDIIKRSFVRFERVRKYPWLNMYYIPGIPVELTHIIGFNLRFYGFIEEDSLVVTRKDESYITTIPEIEYGQGPMLLKKLDAQMVAKISDAVVNLKNG